ncbi:MAG: hypothetical protein ACFFEV_09955 [Candidatus Thorarchaeota archaeon]
MADQDTTDVFVFCDECQQNIILKLSDEILSQRSGGILSVVSIHGNPEHAVLFYLDGNLTPRGCESLTVVQAAERDAVSESSESELPKPSGDALTLERLVETFSSKKKHAIDYLARIVVQLMINNNVYVAHNNPSVSQTICDNIRLLFTNQEVPLYSIKSGDTEKISGSNPVVFDLETEKFLTEGISVDSKHFQLLIKKHVDEYDGQLRLKGELSKILFSYGIIRSKLLDTNHKFLDTELAKMAAIDVTLIPILLKIAEMERIDTKDRVTFNGLGRALRSF